jgi:HIV-1 Vpr-binding protein
MREPVLQDKRQEHVKFQKYGLELLEQVSGRIKSNVNEFELSLAKIHKADVVCEIFKYFYFQILYTLYSTRLHRRESSLTKNSYFN